MRIYPKYPRNADNIHEVQIISTERGDTKNADNIHKMRIIYTIRTK